MQQKFTKRPYIEDVGPRKIKSIQFSMLSDSEIAKAAEVQVYQALYYDPKSRPIEGGLLDPRMGPANKSGKCATCHGNFADCPGHYGYLSLALPVYNVGYLSTILDILKCICKSCSRIILDEKLCKDYLKRMRSPKIDALKKGDIMKSIVKKCSAMASSKAVKCWRCGYVNGTVKKAVAMLGIIHDRSKINDNSLEEFRSAISHTKESKASFNVATYVLNPVKVLSLFKRMTDLDCELLYLSDRPEKLIITNIAVPPIPIRPSVIMDGSQSNENDITERLKRIIQANASLRQELVETNAAFKCLGGWEMLQVEVAQYINSDVRGVPFSMQVSKPLSGFVQRIKGKHGRFRGNLSGKRVEYTGRTVISPDPNLKITEVAIPIHMARILTYPERVSNHNIEKLRQCVRNGPSKYPGARMVRYPDGSARLLIGDYRKRLADELKFGCVVDRHLEDGDIVLFNRQPSLHRMSIMCHRARIMPWRTLRFNESVCNPYNADFDGDEMNMHVPQTEEARTEALMLMGVQNNLCTPKNGEILVASTQDFLTSSFLITRKDIFYDRAAFSLICSYMGDGMDLIDLPTPALLKPIELWTGKQLFSVLLRPHASVRVYLNLIVKERNYSKKIIKRIGNKEIEVETMCPDDGFVYIRNSELICGQLGKATLGNGNKDGLYSVLLRDYNAHAAAACMNRLAKLSARWIGNHGFSIGIDDVQPGKRLNDEKALTISGDYKKCDEEIQTFNEGKLKPKPGYDAAQTLEANVTAILNNIRDKTGKVCMKELHWRNSPLIMSQCGSKGSAINISQMIACVGQQSVGGRRAPNGFIDRSLPHFHRGSKTPAAKGFVANSFYSGLTATEFFFHTMAGREGLVDTAVKTAETGYMSRRLIKALEDLSIHYDNTVRNASGCIVQFIYGDDGMDPACMEGKSGFPLNFDRLLMKVKATCPPIEQKCLHVGSIMQMLEEQLAKHDPAGVCSEAFKKSLKGFLKSQTNELDRVMKLVNNCAQKSEILEKVGHKISGISDRQLEVFVSTCISRYRSKVIEAGTAIGAIGAQSIGEPGTQMTLKTFHFAGVASMNITQGVPRIKEIINAAKRISTPVITAELEFDDNPNIAQIVKGRIEKTVLGQVAKSIKIVITSRSASVVITLDMEIILDAELYIDANIVKESILQTPKIKLKEQHVKVLDGRKLEVVPPADRSQIHFELHSLKNLLPLVVVKGIKTVERTVVYDKNKEKKNQKEEETTKHFQLLVEGTGLQAVMGIEGIDGRRTWSNHVMEMEQILGIEAARKCIIDEIAQTMEHHGMTIDRRHMMLLADVMTFRGEVLGITRFGIQKMDKSILMLASFERTADHLFNAAVNGRDDKIEGVTECIIMGIPMQIGTGILKVIQRVDPPPMLRYGPDPVLS
ncbi:DNA-directed RNA polymerase [Theobroma cacao]|uniref:DNA-directed RNA polymerase subunit n=1 Tax=Theobroma cacao TaxID=3641 RepID=A0A061FU60_THECC|nr:DNA-directed RNA polymerase [Theobroma cacao]